MRKLHTIKEALIATSVIVFITFLISALPLKNEFLKGVRQDVNGFDVYDLTFADDKNSAVRDSNIVIVEIGNSRDEIAEQINIIETYKPAVVAVDAYFEQPIDSLSDHLFLEVVSRYKNLVFASHLDTVLGQKGRGKKIELVNIRNFFDEKKMGLQSGYINFVGDPYSVVRTYSPFVTINDTLVPAFTSKIMELFSQENYRRLAKQKDKETVINYSGNAPQKYTSISREELLEYHVTNQLPTLFKNKIILLGYFVKYPPFVLEDLHFSPLNKHIAGKGFPDMYGVAIHANVLTMVLENKIASLASNKTAFFFAFLFTFLFLWYVIYLYSIRSHPSHAKILLIQFLLILVIIYFFLQVFNIFLWKVPLSSIVISLVLCIELLGLYKLLALWLNKKTGFVTVFNKKHTV